MYAGKRLALFVWAELRFNEIRGITLYGGKILGYSLFGIVVGLILRSDIVHKIIALAVISFIIYSVRNGTDR